jgi:hypothetical protein
MRPPPVVVQRVLGEDPAQVSLAEDQYPVGHLGPQGQHEAFGVGLSITTRRPTVRRLDGA